MQYLIITLICLVVGFQSDSTSEVYKTNASETHTVSSLSDDGSKYVTLTIVIDDQGDATVSKSERTSAPGDETRVNFVTYDGTYDTTTVVDSMDVEVSSSLTGLSMYYVDISLNDDPAAVGGDRIRVYCLGDNCFENQHCDVIYFMGGGIARAKCNNGCPVCAIYSKRIPSPDDTQENGGVYIFAKSVDIP